MHGFFFQTPERPMMKRAVQVMNHPRSILAEIKRGNEKKIEAIG
jgi:hypothetical protein